MSPRGWYLRARALFAPRAAERELDEELRYHVERQTELLVGRGVAPAEARRRALASLGGMESTKEAYREGRGDRWLVELVGDARYALRTLRRSPALTAAAVITLALGIGASVAIFTVVNAVILRPLPYREPERLVALWESNPDKGWVKNIVAAANLLDWKEQVSTFASVGGYLAGMQVTLTGLGEPQILPSAHVTGALLSTLGVPPALGRTFEEAETWQTGVPVVILSHRAWRDRLSGARDVIGRSVELDGRLHQIVGVMPEGFAFPTPETEAWIPLAWQTSDRSQIWFRRAHYLSAVARLKPGVSLDQANAALQVVVRRLQQQYPETNTNMGAGVGDLHGEMVGGTRTPLLVLLAATSLLLLIACANVGNLMLVRAAGREREIVLRRALGAGALRLVRQQLTESLVLSALGGAAGFVLGWWGTRALLALQPAGLLPVEGVSPDLWVFAFALAVTAMSGVLFGVAPALWSGRRAPADVLKEDTRGASAGRRARAWERGLVVGEVAIAVLLTVGAGLLARSYDALTRQDPGFEPSGVLTVTLALPGVRYDSHDKIVAFFAEIVRRVERVPGVAGAAVVSQLPLTGGGWTSDFSVAGRAPGDFGIEVTHRQVSPEYFRTLRVPLLSGRFFTDADEHGGEPVVLINQALADRYFRGTDPLGQMLAFDRVPDSTSVWRRIVGVVGNERQASLARDPQIEIFAPQLQIGQGRMSLVIRATSGGPTADPTTLVAPVRRVVADLNPSLALQRVRTLGEVRAESLARERFFAALLGVFALVGLAMALVGVYGVMAQQALQRTREMGIRIALGAPSAKVRWLIVGHGVALTATGIAIGLAAASVATRVMASLLFRVDPVDPVTFMVVPIVLLSTGVLATWLPALRATRADPAQALRAV